MLVWLLWRHVIYICDELLWPQYCSLGYTTRYMRTHISIQSSSSVLGLILLRVSCGWITVAFEHFKEHPDYIRCSSKCFITASVSLNTIFKLLRHHQVNPACTLGWAGLSLPAYVCADTFGIIMYFNSIFLEPPGLFSITHYQQIAALTQAGFDLSSDWHANFIYLLKF